MRRKKRELQPLPRTHDGRRIWMWRLLPGEIPLAHQEVEAMADLADYLRDVGYVCESRPSVTIKHGEKPTMVLMFKAYPANSKEKRILGGNKS